jgi:hypothetical protein
VGVLLARERAVDPHHRAHRREHEDDEDGRRRERQEVGDRKLALGDRRRDHDEHRADDRAADAEDVAYAKLLAQEHACNHLVGHHRHRTERRYDRGAGKAKRDKIEHLAADRADEADPPERPLGVGPALLRW